MNDECPKCGAKLDVDLDRDNPQAYWECGSFPFVGAMEDCPDTIYQADKCRIRELETAIRAHRDQRADDRCIEDDDKLYAALGDGVTCDRRVGSKADMLKNCERFIQQRCEGGGPWKSYAELEAENARLRRGDFTPEEFQNLCHKEPPLSFCDFAEGCHKYQRELFGKSDRDEAKGKIASLEIENALLRNQVIAGVYDAASVGITLIKTAELDKLKAERQQPPAWLEAAIAEMGAVVERTKDRMEGANQTDFLLFEGEICGLDYAIAILRRHAVKGAE